MEITTRHLTSPIGSITIHAICTGYVALKKAAYETTQPGLWATVKAFRNPDFSEWMPIYAWLIQHPDGNFLIDTGENAQVNEDTYFKPLGWLMNYYFTQQMGFRISRAEEIDVQLKTLGLDKNDIDWIFLTHLHVDHTDGLMHFPDTPVKVNRLEMKKQHGVFPKLFPDHFHPELLEFDTTYETFGKACFLNESKDIIAVHTPGHTYGHSSVLIRFDEGYLLLAGDAIYRQEQLFNQRYSATVASRQLCESTISNIKSFASKHSTVILPSHDMASGSRLKALSYLRLD